MKRAHIEGMEATRQSVLSLLVTFRKQIALT